MQNRLALKSDVDCLLYLNGEYIRSVQASDVSRFQEILADDFLCSLPDGSLLDREEFLKYTAAPVKFSHLEAHDVNVRLMGEFAIIHARTSYACQTDGTDTAATPMCGPGGTADGSLCRLTLRVVRVWLER